MTFNSVQELTFYAKELARKRTVIRTRLMNSVESFCAIYNMELNRVYNEIKEDLRLGKISVKKDFTRIQKKQK